MPELVSLHDAIAENGFEASLTTTFNAYLPFYENVILRRLLAGGCRHNTVLVDAVQLATCLEHAAVRPTCAGYDYTLAPMLSKRAFHPKLLLLVGPKRGVTCIGSHNLTLSGFGLNREVTCKTTWGTSSEDWAADVARTAWRAARGWLDICGKSLPRQTRQNILAIEEIAPWLRHNPADNSNCRLIYQSGGTPSLWGQLSSLVPPTAKRITVIGAFFDARCEFIQRLHSTWPRARLQVVVEPATVQLTMSGVESVGASWYDGSEFAGRAGYLHGKVLFFDTNGREDVLCLGSANPSAPAWGLGDSERNEELAVVWFGRAAGDFATQLGLREVEGLPKISRQLFRKIDAEASARREVTKPNRRVGGIATISGDEIEMLSDALPAGAKRSDVLDEGENLVCEDVRWSRDGEVVRAPLQPGIADRARFLRITTARGVPITLLCHHAERRESAARTGRQAQLRQALSSLEGDPATLANLLAAVQKIVFGADVRVSQVAKVSSNTSSAPMSSKENVTSLEGTAEPAGKRSRPRLAHGDLGYLLQVLIYELGKSLPAAAGAGSPTRSEEEQVGSDDETPSEHPSAYESDQEIAEACGRRVGTLVNRMIRVLAEASRRQDTALTTVAQLTAVLCTLRALRQLDRQDRWRRSGVSLVPEEYRHRMLDGIVEYVIGGQKPLMRRQEVTGAENSMEVGHLRGLMIWLAWECKIRADRRFSLADEREERERNVFERAALLELVVPAVPDADACTEAEKSVEATANPRQALSAREWVRTHLMWGNRVRENARKVGAQAVDTRTYPPIGSVVALPTAGRTLHIVAEQTGNAVVVVDFSAANRERGFLAGNVIRVAPP